MHAYQDETRHYKILNQLYSQLTGDTLVLTPAFQPPVDYHSGVRRAMNDELQAAHLYKRIYLNAQSRNIRDIFFDIMHDEQEHATRFAAMIK